MMNSRNDGELTEEAVSFSVGHRTAENSQSFTCDMTLTATEGEKNLFVEYAPKPGFVSADSPTGITNSDVSHYDVFTKLKRGKLFHCQEASLLRMDYETYTDPSKGSKKDYKYPSAILKDSGRSNVNTGEKSPVQGQHIHSRLGSSTGHHTDFQADSDDEKLKAKMNEGLTSPFQGRSGLYHHQQGMSLRSDAYLRQALTSPYNQKVDRRAAFSDSQCLSRDGSPASLPRSLQSRDTGLRSGSHSHSSPLKEGSNVQHHSSPLRENVSTVHHQDHLTSWGKGSSPLADPHMIFKTPKTRRWMLASPDRRAASSAYSPASSVSGSSSSSSGSNHPFNPFDTGHHRLNFPLFSPTIFHAAHTPGCEESEKFQWNLEHIAELQPVHIDEKEIRRQLSRTSPDDEVDQRVQKAIDYYFRHHMIAPSPWAEAPPPHVLPSTPAYGPAYESIIIPTPKTAAGAAVKKTIDRSCQTTLALSVDFDIQGILGDYMTHQDQREEGGRDSTGSSSLRRKLFLDGDGSSILSPVRLHARDEQEAPDPIAVGLSTPTQLHQNTPEWEGHCSPLHSPSVQFSSSPIRGLSVHDSNYRRTSFPDLGALASPELSPIASKHVVRHRERFPSGDSDIDAGKEASGLGCHVRQQLQIEVHDGSSLHGPLSPAISPIAFHSSDSVQSRSKSYTLKADLSASQDPARRTSDGYGSPPLPVLSPLVLPFTIFAEERVGADRAAPRFRMSSLSEAMEGGGCVEKGSARERSLAETNQEDPEGMSSVCDTLFHQPGHSSTCQDTGYQTGSGSLQTTQEGGTSSVAPGSSLGSATNFSISGANVSMEAANAEQDNALVRKLVSLASTTSRQEQADAIVIKNSSNASVVLEAAETIGSGNQEDKIAERDSQIGSQSIVHSNLTTHFMGLPFRSDISVDLESSMQSLQTVPSSSNLARSDSFHTDRKQSHESDTNNLHSNSRGYVPSFNVKSTPLFNQDAGYSYGNNAERLYANERHLGRSAMEEGPAFYFSASDDTGSLNYSRNLYDRDPAFLDQMASYLQRGEDTTCEDSRRHPSDVSAASFPPGRKEVHFGPEESLFDDSVLVRARKYLASIGHSDGDLFTSGDSTSSLQEKEQGQECLGVSTPRKRLLMGRVVEGLTAGKRSPGSPALASDVAQEIMRRAKMDLRHIDRCAHQRSGSS